MPGKITDFLASCFMSEHCYKYTWMPVPPKIFFMSVFLSFFYLSTRRPHVCTASHCTVVPLLEKMSKISGTIHLSLIRTAIQKVRSPAAGSPTGYDPRRPIGSKEDSLQELAHFYWSPGSHIRLPAGPYSKIPPETGGCSDFLIDKSPKTTLF